MNGDEWVDDSNEAPCTDPECWCRYPMPPADPIHFTVHSPDHRVAEFVEAEVNRDDVAAKIIADAAEALTGLITPIPGGPYRHLRWTRTYDPVGRNYIEHQEWYDADRPDTESHHDITITRDVTDADLPWIEELLGIRIPTEATRALAARWSTTPPRNPVPWQPTIDLDADPEHDRSYVPVFPPLRPATGFDAWPMNVIIDPRIRPGSFEFRSYYR